MNERYLQLLSQLFPTVAQAATEIVNLEAISQLPKGTEHFVADLHGENEAFRHILRNASGNIRRKVDELFSNEMSEGERKVFSFLVYYPEEKLEQIKLTTNDLDNWYRISIRRLVDLCREVASKYTRSKVRKALPQDFAYIIEELLQEHTEENDKRNYVRVIVDTIITTQRADDFICALAKVIQQLTIDTLHVLGDIFDRGPGAHLIIDDLINYHSWDIQWGNHDVLWMGARAGNDACICNVIRLSLRYGNMATLEEGYGINLLPLATFALETYHDDPCSEFTPHLLNGGDIDEKNKQLIAKMHKAVTVLQLKAEADIIQKHPEWNMQERCLLNNLDLQRNICTIDGKEYTMTSCSFPTIATSQPSEMTQAERELMKKLHHSFRASEKLRRHINALLAHGSMYKICNGNLLFHASVPLNDDGSLKDVEMFGVKYKGKALMDRIGQVIREAFQQDTPDDYRNYSRDYFLYLWCGKDSPLFDKAKMATFERYFIQDKDTHREEKGNYFLMRDDENVCDHILDAFGVKGEKRHIINGHVPVHASRGENPIKANGKLMVIDGGFSQAYHATTGIAGYTLIYHSRGFQLIQHEPFTNTKDAIQREADIRSTTQIVEMTERRMRVADTDKGQELRQQIEDLKQLLYAYRHGTINNKQ